MTGVLRTRVRMLLFPPRCGACRTLLDWYDASDGRALCSKCTEKWASAEEQSCGVCGLKLGACSCLPEELYKTSAQGLFKLVYYTRGVETGVQSRILYRIKQKRAKRVTEWLAAQLAELLPTDEADMILTWIPRGYRARSQTGTDQAEQLARAVAAQTGLCILPLIKRRRRGEQEQKHLSPAARLQNAKQSFLPAKALAQTVSGRAVVLVDDIVTTGASMAACTRILQKAGAARVYCMAVASDDRNRDKGCLSPLHEKSQRK